MLTVGAIPEDLAAAQGFQGNFAILDYLTATAAPPPEEAWRGETTWRNGVECPSCHPGKHETQVDPTKDAAYEALIAALHGSQAAVVSPLREAASALAEPARTLALDLVEAFDSAIDVLIWGVLFQVGAVVGFVEGLVAMVEGIVAIVRWLLEGCAATLYSVLDGGAWQDQWATDTTTALWAFVDGVPFLVMDWVERVGAASPDRRAAMIGELVGQVVAAIATTKGLAAAAPKISVTLPTLPGPALAVEGGPALATAGAGVAVVDTAPAAVGVVAMAQSSALGGGSYEFGPERYKAMGMTGPERHHVFPQEERPWFEDHGFEIDDFCVELDEAGHYAVHRMNWNERVMTALREAEAVKGAPLTPDEILAVGEEVMVDFKISGPFVPYEAPR